MKWIPFVITMGLVVAVLIPKFWDLFRNPLRWDRDRRVSLLVVTAYFILPMMLAFLATASTN